MSWRPETFFCGSLVVALAGLSGADAFAEDNPEASHLTSPFIEAKVTDEGKSVDLGLELYPKGFPVGGRLTASVIKADEDKPPAEISNEGYDVGLRLQLLTEFGESPRSVSKSSTSSASISRWGAGLDARWGVSQFTFNPVGVRKRLAQSIP